MYKRIIPCLDIKGTKVVKGVNFNNIVNLGNVVKLSEEYSREGADEIVALNIAKEKISFFSRTVKKISKKIFVPLTVGGNIIDINDVKLLFGSGADKICLNSTLYYNPSLVKEIKLIYGSQCIVASIDVKKKEREWFVYINGGKTNIGYNVSEWIKKNEENGIGEILLTSIDKDGNKKGYDYELYRKVSRITNLPIIASGGAGGINDILRLFKKTKVNSALAAGIFHKKDVSLKEVKKIINKYFRIRK
ncbi:Imidazole glycerol phosphate synthase cyclase subunit [Candidatus Vidania fulgoroideae]|nr:Imidazole glycerol phosphate synthase cyclase subunit [Candidatus Vidania fulgoroideae]